MNRQPKPNRISWGDILVVVAIIVVFAWVILTASRTQADDSVEYHHARAAIAIAYHRDDSKPDSDICPACNGAGEVGDGRIMHKCEECNGTGKRTTMVAQLDIDDTQDDEYPALQKSFEYFQNQYRRTCENPNCDCKNCDCENCTCGTIVEIDHDQSDTQETIEAPQIVMPEIEWLSTDAGTTDVGTVYMLSEDWCKSCPQGKRNAEAAGIPFETITVQQAADLGLIEYKATTIPRLIFSKNIDSPLVGAQSVESMRSWYSKQPKTVATPATVTAVVNAQFSGAALTAAVAEHLARQQDGFDMPVGGLFDREIQAPNIVPEMLQQIMLGQTVEVEDAGVSIAWLGDGRSILLESAEQVTLTPPATVTLNKWGLSVSTTLAGFAIADEGRTVRLQLKGPDFTVKFR